MSSGLAFAQEPTCELEFRGILLRFEGGTFYRLQKDLLEAVKEVSEGPREMKCISFHENTSDGPGIWIPLRKTGQGPTLIPGGEADLLEINIDTGDSELPKGEWFLLDIGGARTLQVRHRGGGWLSFIPHDSKCVHEGIHKDLVLGSVASSSGGTVRLLRD